MDPAPSHEYDTEICIPHGLTRTGDYDRVTGRVNMWQRLGLSPSVGSTIMRYVYVASMAIVGLTGLWLVFVVGSESRDLQLSAIGMAVFGGFGAAYGLFSPAARQDWDRLASRTRAEVGREVYFACAVGLLVYGVWLTATTTGLLVYVGIVLAASTIVVLTMLMFPRSDVV